MHTDLVIGNENRYGQMYDPRRDIPDLSDSNSETSGDDDHCEELSISVNTKKLEAGDAAIVEKNDERTGDYKGENGGLYYIDLICTHMGCDLQWNNGDKTWDCSCHGSHCPPYKSLKVIASAKNGLGAAWFSLASYRNKF